MRESATNVYFLLSLSSQATTIARMWSRSDRKRANVKRLRCHVKHVSIGRSQAERLTPNRRKTAMANGEKRENGPANSQCPLELGSRTALFSPLLCVHEEKVFTFSSNFSRSNKKYSEDICRADQIFSATIRIVFLSLSSLQILPGR